MTSTHEGRIMRFALIGCGDIGILRAKALARTPNARLAITADTDAAKALAAAAVAPGAVAVANWRDAVARDVDAVIISTPPSLHEEMSVAALAAGKHVLCEKPLARSPSECRAMVAAAERSGKRLATGFNYRFYPSFKRAREVFDSGMIGELDHIRSYGRPHRITSRGSTTLRPLVAALRDIGIHLIDLTRLPGDVATAGAAVASGSTRGAKTTVAPTPARATLPRFTRAGPVATLPVSSRDHGSCADAWPAFR
jgi:predicted dehydrogenase